jgi:hypothetical protein
MVSTPMAARHRLLAAIGYCDTERLRRFASVHKGALVEKWQLFGAAALFSEAA